MTKIMEYEKHDIIIMHCYKCNTTKAIRTDNVKFAYLEINKFRKEHEHLLKKEKGNKIK